MTVSNPTAALVIIGNELLSGQTQDLNVAYLAKKLFDRGIEVKEVRMILDHEATIIETVLGLSSLHSYVFTTGGIGPTHDDITAQSIAKAFNVPLIKHPEALKRLYARYPHPKAPEAMERMAYVPEGAILIDNPVSAAPGFYLYNVYVMAGIPAIMQEMFKNLMPHLKKGIPRSTIHMVISVAESVIAQRLREIQESHPTIEIGSYPKWAESDRSVMIVIKGVAGPELEHVREKLRHLFHIMEIEHQEWDLPTIEA